MTLQELTEKTMAIVDQLLVDIANNPSAENYSLPILDPYQCPEVDYITNKEVHDHISTLREYVYHQYLSVSLNTGELELTEENLFAFLYSMRNEYFISFKDLWDYHEKAYYFYQSIKNSRKAAIHERQYLYYKEKVFCDNQVIKGRFYHMKESCGQFKSTFLMAELGIPLAIKEVSRRFREGDGVATCELAAKAWEHKLRVHV